MSLRFPRKPFVNRRNRRAHQINDEIRSPQVRVVGENVQVGVYPIAEALRMADESGLDLVLISDKADPPVCRMVDYQKFLYDQKKKQKELKSKAAKVIVKEIRFGPNTEEHDFNFKQKHAVKFLKDGAKIKAFVFFRGRSIVYKNRGEILLLRLAQEVEDYGKVEQLPRLEGNRMIMFLTPKKGKG